jgi:hypothetical protein
MGRSLCLVLFQLTHDTCGKQALDLVGGESGLPQDFAAMFA